MQNSMELQMSNAPLLLQSTIYMLNMVTNFSKMASIELH